MTTATFAERLPRAGRVRPARSCRREFPIFANNPGLVFLDSGASAQKPAAVIDGVADYYRTDYANVHRGVYRLSARSTELFEEAREKVRRLPECRRPARDRLRARRHRGDQPRRAELGRDLSRSRRRGADQRRSSTIRTSCRGRCCAIASASSWWWRRSTRPAGSTWRAFEAAACPRAPGSSRSPISPTPPARWCRSRRSIRLAHRRGAKVLVDGCQAAPRLPVDVQALGCDFYAFSGHKTYGPTGIGVLYGRYDLLSAMPPWQGGGEMILNVTFEKTEYPGAAAPLRGRHPGHFGRDRARRRDRFHRGAGARQHPRARGGADRLRRRPVVAHSGLAAARRRAASARHSVVRSRRRAPARSGAPCSTTTMWPCAPGITAPSRCSKGSASRQRPAPRSASTTTSATSIALAAAIEAGREMFAR